jgi:hypothetical protein
MWADLRLWCSRKARNLWKAMRALGRPRVRETHFRYQYAGLSVADEPIPWCAEQVRVEAVVAGAGLQRWRKNEFTLHLPDGLPVSAEALHPSPHRGTVHLCFTLPPPRHPITASLCWRGYVLAELSLPCVSAEEFVGGLRLEEPTLLAQLDTATVPCQAVVASQLRGLLACGVLVSPTSLAPLLELDMAVEFTNDRTGAVGRVAPVLGGSQLAGRRAVLGATPPGAPREGEAWEVRWLVAGRCLAQSRLRALSLDEFQQSLDLVDARYAYRAATGPTAFRPHLPPRGTLRYVGPCFRLASADPGAAGVCPLALRIRFKDPARLPYVVRQDVLVTDGPSTFMPLLFTSQEFEQMTTFEVLIEGRPHGSLPGCRPVLRFTGEGGFTDLTEFDWTPVAAEELQERLSRLMEVPQPGTCPGLP